MVSFKMLKIWIKMKCYGSCGSAFSGKLMTTLVFIDVLEYIVLFIVCLSLLVL